METQWLLGHYVKVLQNFSSPLPTQSVFPSVFSLSCLVMRWLQELTLCSIAPSNTPKLL